MAKKAGKALTERGARSMARKRSGRDFPVVGIGASAGGLNALIRLLNAMPDRLDMAFIVIQHLDPTKESLTVNILAKHTAMKVVEVEDEPRVVANCVYVIPPNKYLSMANGLLRLSEPEQRRGARVPIDYFFRSLAEDARQRAIAVILSGTGSDGTLGLKSVKAEGGLVIVQDPHSAEHTGMPESAIATGLVDYILPVEKIPQALVHYRDHAPLEAEEKVARPEEGRSELSQLLGLLRSRSKHDFRCYKEGTLLRRTQRRMSLHKLSQFAEYLGYLREHPAELDALVKDLLISVTDFFRDREAWEGLEERVMAPLVEAKPSEALIRVWVAGCATGEEAYSVAILLLEHLLRTGKHCRLQVFASDIDRDALERARHGRYPSTIVGDVTAERLDRFFERDPHDGYYRVSKPLRESVIFAEQNLIADPPFSRLDLICCRNLLIYLRPEVQEKIITLFHFALLEGGYLFLGGSETIGRHEDLFQPVLAKMRIYRRIGVTQHERVAFPVAAAQPRHEIEPAPPLQHRDVRMAHIAQQRLLDWLAPRAVLVDRSLQIVYFCGDTDAYLTHTPGAATQDLLAKARQGLRTTLRGLAQKAFGKGETVAADARVNRDGHYLPVRISARPIRDPASEEELVLVVFEEAGAYEAQSLPEKSAAARAGTAATRETTEIDTEEVIRQLEDELATTKEDLQSTIEQLESSNEEFKAANEEVMSINEELETSKEELQSLNEELNTVNNQLALKVEELERNNNDLNNLLTSTDLATICLDRAFTIRWFTPAMTRLINLVATDIGRPLVDFSHKFTSEDLLEEARTVLEQLTPTETEVSTLDERSFLRRITPYRTGDAHIDGVVITLVDITPRKQAEESLRRSEEELRRLNQSLEQQVVTRSEALQVLQDVTVAANLANTVGEAMREVLLRICSANRWLTGHAYRVDGACSDRVVSSGIWCVREDAPDKLLKHLSEFHKSFASIRFALGEGVIGRVLKTGQPEWVGNISESSDWCGVDPSRYGLHSQVAFPVTVNGRVVAALQFFSDEPIEQEKRFLEIMPNVGIQLGHVIRRKELEKEVAEISNREQQQLGQQLHDGLSQQISGIALLADGLAESLRAEGQPIAAKAQRLVEEIAVAKQQSRDLTKGLLPVAIEPEGLMNALSELSERIHKLYEVPVSFECHEAVSVTDSFTATHLYRIAYEAIHNAVKHARARHISLCLSNEGQKLLVVKDDGIGMKDVVENRGYGIRIMEYRAGLIDATLTIESHEGGGTRVICRLIG